MGGILTFANWLLPLLYLALLIDYGATFFLRTKTHTRNPGTMGVVALHALLLVLWAIHIGRPPLASGYEVLSVLAFSTAAVYCVLELAVRDRRAGVFIFTLVFLFQYTSSVFLAGNGAEVAAQSNWARLHIVPAIIAYTAFAVGAIYGLLHLLAHRNLKKHSVGVLFDRLPPFDLLGKMSWHALLVGFIFMTISIATGPILFKYAGSAEPARVWDPKITVKIVIGSIAWIIYGTAVVGKFVGKWSPPRVSRVGLTGFVVTMILIIASAVLS